MALSYLDAIRQGFTSVMATCSTDPYVYDNIDWTGGDALPSQDDLDAYIAAQAAIDSLSITKFQFRQLFTLTERVACDNFNINASIPAQYKAVLVTMFKDLELSGEVQLSLPQTQQGVRLLAQVGLITAARAEDIIANRPAPTV